MAPKRVLKTLTISEKVQLIKDVTSGVKKTDAAKKYGVKPSTVSGILKKKDVILKSAENLRSEIKRVKKPKFENVNNAVFKWFETARARNLPVSGTLVKEKALQYATHLGQPDFKASNGWIDKWKKRYEIVQKKTCGESAEINVEDCINWKKNILPNLLEQYESKNIFNADETSLFFKCLPNKTLTFKNEKCFGGKHSKERVTCLLMANLDGSEKMKILLIGKSKNPRCFRNMRHLPVQYEANSKSWMTGKIFEEWLINMDKKFEKQNRNILLFIDNCPSHPVHIQQKLKWIKLKYFPPNMTSKLQPLDQGIIASLKIHYRRRLLTRAIEHMETYQDVPKFTLLDCVEHLSKAWEIDVKSETIQNCFKKAGFEQFSTWEDDDDIPLIFLKEGIMTASANNLFEDNEFQNCYEKFMTLQNLPQDSFEEYATFDDDVVTSQIPTDECILEEFSAQDEDLENEEDDPEIQPPTKREALHALQTLRRYIYTKESSSEDIFFNLNKIEDFIEKPANLSQSFITDYFKV